MASAFRPISTTRYSANSIAWANRIATGAPVSVSVGLAIVDRLCRLLDHPIEVKSTVGKGSMFAVTVPLAPADKRAIEASIVPRAQPSLANDKLVLVIDDDPLVLEGMSGIFRKWGCRVDHRG